MNYLLKGLSEKNQKEIEEFFTQASDYAIFESGKSQPDSEARNLLNDLPDGKEKGDKIVLGIFGENAELIGVIDLIKNFPTQGEWMLGLLDLIPAVRKHGLGKKVHQDLVNLAKSEGATSLRIGVLQGNGAALRFWSSLGYKKIKESTMVFGNKTHQVEVMILKL